MYMCVFMDICLCTCIYIYIYIQMYIRRPSVERRACDSNADRQRRTASTANSQQQLSRANSTCTPNHIHIQPVQPDDDIDMD